MKMINGDVDIYQYVASIEKCSDKSLHVKRKDPSRGESNDIGNSRNQQFVMAKLDGIGKVRSRDDFVYKDCIESRNSTLSGPSYLVDDIVPKKNLEQLMNRFFTSQRGAVPEVLSVPSKSTSEISSSTDMSFLRG